MPTDRMDDKKMSETDAAVGLVASTAAAALMDATEKSPNESPIPHVVVIASIQRQNQNYTKLQIFSFC